MAKSLQISDLLPDIVLGVGFSMMRCKAYVGTDLHIFGTEPQGIPGAITGADRESFAADWIKEHPADTKRTAENIAVWASNDQIRHFYYVTNAAVGKDRSGSIKPKDSARNFLSAMLECGRRLAEVKGSTAKCDSDFVAQQLLHLCNEFGLLTHQDAYDIGRVERDAREGIEFYRTQDETLNSSIYFGFDKRIAFEQLVNLYATYLSWKALQWGITSDEERRLESLLQWCGMTPDKTGEDAYREFITLNCTLISSVQIVEFDSDGRPFAAQWYPSPLNAAHGAMLKIIAMGAEALKHRSLAICQRCGGEFIKLHGSQKFCKDCGNNTVRVMEFREKKAKEAENGKKSE